MVPQLKAARTLKVAGSGRSSPLSAFKSNFPPVDGPEPTTDKPAAKTESDAATDASRAALEASFAKAEAEPVAAATPAAGAALLDALTGKTKGAELGPLIDACEASYDRRSFDEKNPWSLETEVSLDGKKAQRRKKCSRRQDGSPPTATLLPTIKVARSSATCATQQEARRRRRRRRVRGLRGHPEPPPERHRRRVDSDPGGQALWHSNAPHPAPAEGPRVARRDIPG